MASNPNQDRYQCTADPSHTVAQAGTRCNDCISKGKPPLNASRSKAASLRSISSNMRRSSVPLVMPRSSGTYAREPARLRYCWMMGAEDAGHVSFELLGVRDDQDQLWQFDPQDGHNIRALMDTHLEMAPEHPDIDPKSDSGSHNPTVPPIYWL